MAFTSQTVNTTAESGVTIQEMWEEVRSEEHVAEICWDTWAVALKSNTGVRAFIHKTVMNEVIKKVKKKKKVPWHYVNHMDMTILQSLGIYEAKR